MNKKNNLRILVEGGLMIALSFALSQIKLFKMPQGGSVTLGSMVPILIFALRRGVPSGIIAGLSLGLLKLAFGGDIYSPFQAILDYPLAFMSLGLAGIFSNEFMTKKTIKPVIIGSFIGILGRLVCHVLSGVIFFGSYAPEGVSPLVHSITYNGTFLGVEFLIAVVVIYILRSFILKELSNERVGK